jgi:hypothetical protein
MGHAKSALSASATLIREPADASRLGFTHGIKAADILSLISRLRARRLRQYDGGCGHATADVQVYLPVETQ